MGTIIKSSTKYKAAKPRGKQHGLRSATLLDLAKAHRTKWEEYRVMAQEQNHCTENNTLARSLMAMHKDTADILEATAASTRAKR